jgi:hypothetical protein
VDSAPKDGPHGDAVTDGARLEGRIDARLVDLRPDGPRPPAAWKKVPVTPNLDLEDHTATLLSSGDVLVVGGVTGSGSSDPDVYHKKAYRYVAAQNAFVDAGAMAAVRAEHSATLLPDGRVLVVGGIDDSSYYLTSVEIYDPAKPAPSAWSAGPQMIQSAWQHSAVRLQDGKVLISGGTPYGVDSTEKLALFDPATNTWSVPATVMKVKRRLHSSTLLKNGKVLFAGGTQGTGPNNLTFVNSLEIYDPVQGSTTLLAAKLETPRAAHTATLLDDGRVLIVGGSCTGSSCGTGSWLNNIYDPATDKITPVAHPGDAPSGHCAVKLQDGRVLVFGDSEYVGGEYVGSVKTLAFSPAGAGSWSNQPDLLVGRWSASCVMLTDGTVLAVAGVTKASGPRTYADTERFYP